MKKGRVIATKEDFRNLTNDIIDGSFDSEVGVLVLSGTVENILRQMKLIMSAERSKVILDQILNPEAPLKKGHRMNRRSNMARLLEEELTDF